MDGDSYIQALTKWIQREGKRLAQRNPDPPIAISLHHLYYLLTRFDDLEVPIGPLNIRLENINDDHQPSGSASSNYVSFSRKNSDAASIRSVSSIRSVMSSVSYSVWTGFGVFGSSTRSEEQVAEDLKQLYSAFCKIPTIRISPHPLVKSITGFEEYPFDTAVPLLAFKNLQCLEIFNYSPKQFYGWDEISEQLRSLVLKRSGIKDVATLTISVIQEEHAKKRRKAERATRHWQTISDGLSSSPGSPRPGTQPTISQAKIQTLNQSERPRSASPTSAGARPPPSGRRTSNYNRQHSSGSISPEAALPYTLPSSKWRFLRFLNLSDNGLSSISVESLAPLVANLNFLDLSKNNFSRVPAALSTLSSLRSLDLSQNKIESLHSLLQSPLPGISTLNLRANILQTIAGIERLPSLERVDLRDNLLKDPTELARLNTAPNFSEVWVAGNAFTRTHSDYKIAIFNIFRANASMTDDISLDGRKPGMIEKRSLVARAVEILPAIKSSSLPASKGSAPPTPSKEAPVETPINTIRPDKTKKKVHKSRIIDLSSSSGEGIADSEPIITAGKEVVEPVSSKSAQLEQLSGEDYRRKIEALKQEVGSNWIRVINEDSFRPNHSVPVGLQTEKK